MAVRPRSGRLVVAQRFSAGIGAQHFSLARFSGRQKSPVGQFSVRRTLRGDLDFHQRRKISAHVRVNPQRVLVNIGGVKTQVASQSKNVEALVAKLTRREHEIIALVAEGLKNKEIAARLSISPATVRHHLSAIFAKLEVTDRLKLIVFAFRNGLAAPFEKSKK